MILDWFTGQAHTRAVEALELLQASAAQGFWLPGAARKVRAALSKSNVARKIGRASNLDCVGYDEARYVHAYEARHAHAFEAYMALIYGHAPRRAVDCAAVRSGPLSPEQQAGIDAFERYVADFAEYWATMATLDATRPKPTITSMGVSPTVAQTLALMLNTSSPLREGVVPAPIEFERVETVDPDTGHTSYRFVARVVWPEKTVHGSSQYAGGSQCHACGHRIKNPYNWVPMLATDTAGVPHSLWVGRDCAEALFGIKLAGELETKDIARDAA